MLEKKITVDLIEVTEGSVVQVRTKTAIIEDGVQASCSFHRHVIVPGACYSDEDTRVKAVCAAVHTDEVISNYQSTQGV